MNKLIMLGLLAIGGCRYAEVSCGTSSGDLAEYIDFLREIVQEERQADDDRAADWMVGAAITTRERKATYEVVYADKDYLSFRAVEYKYNGGAHGSTAITVGTIDRRTGKLLKAADLVPEKRRAEVLKELRAGVVKAIGGEDQLQAEVKLIDNCYVAKDGIHFIYNEYEVACYAAGSVEVVVGAQKTCQQK